MQRNVNKICESFDGWDLDLVEENMIFLVVHISSNYYHGYEGEYGGGKVVEVATVVG